MYANKGEVIVKRDGGEEPPKVFTFDGVFNEMVMQKELFDDTAMAIINQIFEGYNGTIFAYGQTGTGKTHTMEGEPSPKEARGVMARCFDSIFKEIDGAAKDIQFLV